MTEYSKFNVVYRLQKWMDSVPGQTFLNYAYSWGASLVILGALFKLTHLPMANLMLFIGMGTEVIVFFLSAFDRPFDKTADGLDLPTSLTAATEEEKVENEAPAQVKAVSGVKTIVLDTTPKTSATESSADRGAAAGTPAVANHGEWVSQQQDIAPEMAEATSNYVEELNKLTIMLGKVSEQSARLTRDSEEMENLNRTLTGICKVYELQLKSASSQIGTIDQINEQTQKMAKQIAELNKIYTRMIEAMTVNMRQAAPGVMPMASDED